MSTPERSDGARRERKAMRAYLRRQIQTVERDTLARNGPWQFKAVLSWVLGRQRRYDARRGGLGK